MHLSIVFANERDRPQQALDLAGELPAGRAPRMLPVRAQSSLGFRHIVRTMACGQHGLRLWCPQWGNTPLTFDGSPAAQFVEPLRRSAVSLALIAAGAYPSIRVLADSGSPAEREAA
jgi:hypothetical protein